MRSGHMKQTHPVGRQLDLLAQLAGGFLLYIREGSCGGEAERWTFVIPTASGWPSMIQGSVPISSTPDEARAALARVVGEALGR